MHLRITLSVSVYSFIMVVGQAGFTSYSQRADIYIVRAKIQSSNRRQAVAFMKKKYIGRAKNCDRRQLLPVGGVRFVLGEYSLVSKVLA